MLRYFFNFLLLAALATLIPLVGCGKRKAPPYKRVRSQLIVSACDSIAKGHTDEAIAELQRLLDLDDDNPFAEGALHHEQQRRRLSEANELIAHADHLALRLWLEQLIREGQAGPELLALREVAPALEALALFLKQGPWHKAVERQEALAALEAHFPVLQQSVAFQAFYHSEKMQLAAMHAQERRQLAQRLLRELDQAIFSEEQQKQAALLQEFTSAMPEHPLLRYSTHLHAETTPESLQALLGSDEPEIPASENALAATLAAAMHWHELSHASKLAIQKFCQQQENSSLCGAWLAARASHQPQHYHDLFSYLRSLPEAPPLPKELLRDYLKQVLLPTQALNAWCWRSPAPGVTDFLARLTQVGETQPLASNEEHP